MYIYKDQPKVNPKFVQFVMKASNSSLSETEIRFHFSADLDDYIAWYFKSTEERDQVFDDLRPSSGFEFLDGLLKQLEPDLKDLVQDLRDQWKAEREKYNADPPDQATLVNVNCDFCGHKHELPALYFTFKCKNCGRQNNL